MPLIHETADDGKHRVILQNAFGSIVAASPWAPYQSPALVEIPGQESRVAAVTPYYTGSKEFPDPNKFYEIKVSESPYENRPAKSST